jgi:hypothetical protein
LHGFGRVARLLLLRLLLLLLLLVLLWKIRDGST